MNSFLKIVFILTLFILSPNLSALDKYSIVKLPQDFFVDDDLAYQRYVLNNHGQVVGYISTPTKHAAIWDMDKGIISIKSNDFESRAYTLNDYGFIAIATFEKNNKIRTALWNIYTDEIKYGPFGYPIAMNNFNNMIISESSSNTVVVYDYEKNTIVYSPILYIWVDDNNKLYSPRHNNNIMLIDVNKHGNALAHKNPSLFPELILCIQETLYFLPFDGITDLSAYLNDNNEVVTLISLKNHGNKIAKWNVGKITTSEILQNISEFSNYHSFKIKGFNDNGQILISATSFSDNKLKQLFILSPAE